MEMVIRIAVMSLLVLSMLTYEMSGEMTDGTMDESHTVKRIQPRQFTVDAQGITLCGRVDFWKIMHREVFGASHRSTNDVPDVDTDLNEFPNPGKHVFEVQLPNMDIDAGPNMDTHVDDEPYLNMDIDDEPNLKMDIDDEPNLNMDTDDEPNLDTNVKDRPEMYQHVSDEEDLDKVLGGRYALRGEFPWQVNVKLHGKQLCGGSIINEYYILTSAHCLAGNKASDMIVVVGDYARSHDDPGEQALRVDKLIPYETYAFSRAGGQYDIGLMKIKPGSNKKGIQFNDYVKPVCLPFNDTPAVGTQLIFSGWGFMDTASKNQPDVLKRDIFPLITKQKCKTIYDNGDFAPDMFCAGTINGNNDLCPGDSGGPLVYKNEGTHVVYGLAESSSGCPMPNLPVVFTNVSMYLTWIQQKIQQYSTNSNEKTMPTRPNRFTYLPFIP